MTARALTFAAVTFVLGCNTEGGLAFQSETAEERARTVLPPEWRVGQTWTVEVHGHGGSDPRLLGGIGPHVGVTHYWVESITATSTTVRAEFRPLELGFWAPTRECEAVLRFDRHPWRLAHVHAQSPPGWAEAYAPITFGPSRWTCALPMPRHPAADSRDAAETEGPQVLVLPPAGDPGAKTGVLFIAERPSYDRDFAEPPIIHRSTLWRKGDPWWARYEVLDASFLGYASVLRRCLSPADSCVAVERARLIAIDGERVEPVPWSPLAQGSRDWAAVFWPDGLLPADG